MQRLRRLSRRRSARLDEGAIVIDGPLLLAEALTAALVIEEVVAEPGADADVLARAEAAGATVRLTREGVLRGAVDTVSPQGLAAIATRPATDPADAIAATAAGPLALVLVDVADPGNAGTLLRTAHAFGARAVLLCGTTVDPWNPKCVRASAGSVFHLLLGSFDDPLTALGQLGDAGVARVATVARDGQPPDEVDLRGPVTVVLGSEAHGLDHAVQHACDVAVTIPTMATSESLNVAAAGAVLCYEAHRQRSGGST